ncbi:MAG TPA: COX15/CtaA family protein [Blastocatellia bacterium]|nr:COX15/CtaA family protein [Blastocatellia bacterium]
MPGSQGVGADTNSGTASEGRLYSFAGVHRLIVLLALLTVLLLIAGALVTSNDAGDSVPDWPMSFGRWIVGNRHFVGNVRYEYSHRVVAGTVTLVTFAVAVWAWSSRRLRQQLQWLALATFGGVVLQAALGGVRVLLLGYKVPIAIIHAFVAQSFFCLVVCLWTVTSRSWHAAGTAGTVRTGQAATATLRTLTALTVATVLVQLVLGAGFRHGAWGIEWHIAGAVAVTLMTVWTAVSVVRRHKADRYLLTPALVMCGLLVCQIGLGIAAYVARLRSVDDPQPLEPMVSLTVAHVVVGALTLASVLVLALRCHQVLAPRVVVATPVPPKSAYSSQLG